MSDRRYIIEVTQCARRALARLPASIQRQVVTKIRALANDPRPSGVKKLEPADPPLYRIRSGDYRIVYEIDDAEHKVTIGLIGDRKDVYKRGLS
jgi:mRNA interferase RelE/StbE